MTRRFGHGELHLVLLALLEGRPMHGYELMGELAQRMGQRYRPSPGSIYPALAALQSEGLILASDDRERRTYEITRVGRDALGRRGDQLARIEAQLGVRFSESSVDVLLARFAARVKAMGNVSPERLGEALDRTADMLGSMQREEIS